MQQRMRFAHTDTRSSRGFVCGRHRHTPASDASIITAPTPCSSPPRRRWHEITAPPCPPWFHTYLPLVPLASRRVPTAEALDLFDEANDALIARAIHITFQHEHFARDIAMRLVTRLQRQDTFERYVKFIADGSSPREFAPCLISALDRAADLLRDLWHEEHYTGYLILLLLLANQRIHRADDGIYLEGLGHPNDAIREYAQQGLVRRGEVARPLLDRGRRSFRTSTREWCKSRLEQLDVISREDAPIQNTRSAMKALEAIALMNRIDSLHELKPPAWTQWLEREVAPDPLPWLHATIALFEETPEFIHRWAVFRALLTHEATASHHQVMWRIYLKHLAHTPTLTHSHTQWNIRQHFALIPEDDAQVAMEQALFDASGPMSVIMLEHYFSTGACSAKLLPRGLSHRSQAVRELAIAAASHWPPEGDAACVVALLKSRKKVIRRSAAEALARMPRAHHLAHHDTLKTSLTRERDEATRSALISILMK